MSAPRNNLEDVLRKRQVAASSSSTSSIQQPATPKAKFRVAKAPSTPVRSMSQASTVRTIDTTFTSLSPSGVGKKSVTRLRTPSLQQPIDIPSDESSPISSNSHGIPAKRASPHVHDLPAKRIKASTGLEKENWRQASLQGKSRELPVRVVDFSHTGSTSRQPAQQSRTFPISSHPRAQEPQLATSGALRHFEFDYSDLLNLSIEELQELKNEVVDRRSKWLDVQSEGDDVGVRRVASKILKKIDDVFRDELQCVDELILARKAGDRPTLPQTKWIVSPPPIAPLQPIDTPASPFTRSSNHVPLPNMSDPHHQPSFTIEHSATPFLQNERRVERPAAGGAHSARMDEDEDIFDKLDSDDALWNNVTELTQDELSSASELPIRDQILSAAIPPTLPTSSAPPPTREPSAQTSAVSAPYEPNPALLKTPYYEELTKTLRDVFRLETFRPNQLEAISANMEGKDVFVLMPTGGGKSLCFQLPAVVKNRQCGAITFVVSPLVSLMTDQVMALRAKGVSVIVFSHRQSAEERKDAYARMTDSRPGHRACLAYVTPELLQQNDWMKQRMRALAETKSIAGFVVDEAHCIQTWGRQFRESYAVLSTLRPDFPDVPIMALTATASRQAVNDIVSRLNIEHCERFTMSFNRPNLTYTVERKSSDRWAIEDMVAWVKEKHQGETGIIYCSSRRKCEETAIQLRDKHGLSAAHYHAEVDADEKVQIQQDWQSGKILIIVATIAFGMGIDKHNVRFVVHLHMPMSLSNYYQETGRAGRDGEPADCRLYYSYADAQYPMRRARDDAKTKDDAEDIVAEIRRVVEYCGNNVDCRRMQVLAFFDEKFQPRDCHSTCDNCLNVSAVFEEDVSEAAAHMVRLTDELNGLVTRSKLIDVFTDKLTKELKDWDYSQVPHKGSGKDMPREHAERIFDHLVSLGVLAFQDRKNFGGWSNSYPISVPREAQDFLRSHKQVKLRFKPTPPKRARTKKGKGKESQNQNPEAGPSNPQRTRTKRPVEVPDDPIEDYHEEEPIDLSFWRDDDDDDVEIISGPSKATHTNTGHDSLPNRRASRDDDSEIEIIEGPEDNWERCFTMLKQHRDKLEKREGHSLQDVFGDEELGVISSVLPSDHLEFERELRAMGADTESANIRLVPSFLEVLLPFRTAQTPTTSSRKQTQGTKPLSFSQRMKEYEYERRPGPSSKPNSKR